MYNILICDDQKDIVHALKIYLNSPDYTLFEAYDGKTALDICEKNDIHLLLLDIMMPIMDGISVLSRIRESSNLPVIFLTAKSEDSDKILGLDIGADDYITKPFNPVEVMARVRSALRRYMLLGGGKKQVSASEAKNKPIARKSIVAARPIQKGEIFTAENLTTKRPGDGVSPMKWHQVLGQKAKRDFALDEKIEL